MRAPSQPGCLGTATATALVVASMVGTGVFTTTGLLVEALGSPVAVLAAWGVGGLLAVCGALSYAELAAALPRNGGEYQLLGRIYHPAVGFTAGVISLVVGFAAPLAASALAFGHYVRAVLPSMPPAVGAVTIVVLFLLAHGFDRRWGAGAQRLITSAQVVLIVVMIVAGLALGDPTRVLASDGRATAATIASPSFAAALVFVSFAYSGWNGAVYVAGEVRHASRALPIALVLGTVAVTFLYLGLNLVFLSAAPARDLAGVVEVANAAAVRLVGPTGGRVLSGVIALVLASSVSAMLLAGSRVYEAMGNDYRILAVLARRTRRGAPLAAVSVQALLAIVMVLTASFGALLSFIGFTLSVSAALTVVGVLVLRAREPDLARPYRAWGYPATPLAFVALSTWMAVHAIAERPVSSLAGIAVIAASALLYVVAARAGRSKTAPVLT